MKSRMLVAAALAAASAAAQAQDDAEIPGIEPLGGVPSIGWVSSFPYVQQSHGTCWAATAAMLLRAYGKQVTLFDLMGGMGDAVDPVDHGSGRFGIANSRTAYGRLTGLMNQVAGEELFVLSPSNVQPTEIVGGLAARAGWQATMQDVRLQWGPPRIAGVPFILAGSGHAWLFLNQRTDAGSVRFLVHDPKGGNSAHLPATSLLRAEGGAYWPVGEDWFESRLGHAGNGGFRYVAQVVYPQRAPEAEQSLLQSLAIPFIDNGDRSQGAVCFVQDHAYSRCLAWKLPDTASPRAYGWQECGSQKCKGPIVDAVEVTADLVDLRLELWNADQQNPQAKVDVRATLRYAGGEAPPVSTLETQSTLDLDLARSTEWSGSLSDVCAMRRADRAVDATLDIELWHGGRRVDRLPLAVRLESKPEIVRTYPTVATQRGSLRIQGRGFGEQGSGRVVTLGGSVARVNQWTDSDIEIDVPGLTDGQHELLVSLGNDACAARAKIDLASSPGGIAPPVPPDSAGCWQPQAGTDEARTQIAPPGRGYEGTQSVGPSTISGSTHPSDPKWAHVVTAGTLEHALTPAPGSRLCAGQRVTGLTTFHNTGNQLIASGYSPSGHIAARFSNSGPEDLFRMHSTQLPAPGGAYSKEVDWLVRTGAPGETMRLCSVGYVGRELSYCWDYVWQATGDR